jgi:hypothetical protein
MTSELGRARQRPQSREHLTRLAAHRELIEVSLLRGDDRVKELISGNCS